MTKFAALTFVSALALAAGHADAAARPTPGTSGLRVVDRIAGPDGHWDYASFDPAWRRVYVAHGDTVMVIDADTGKAKADFAPGSHLHTVMAIPGSDLVLTTNSGDSSARILNAADGSLIASVPTAKDPDAAIYDPASRLVLVMGGDSGEITFVDVKAAKAVGSLVVGGALEFPALDGKGRLFVNIEDKNEIAVIDLATRKVVKRYPLAGCTGPGGLAYVTGGRLVSACANGVAKILSAASGKDLATLQIGARPDAVLYDGARKLAYIPSAMTGTLAVIALSGPHDNAIIDSVPTQLGARTGAVDEKTGRIYLPDAQYVLPVPAGQRPTTKPGTFEVLVLDRR